MNEDKTLKIGNILTIIILIAFFLPWAGGGDYIFEEAQPLRPLTIEEIGELNISYTRDEFDEIAAAIPAEETRDIEESMQLAQDTLTRTRYNRFQDRVEELREFLSEDEVARVLSAFTPQQVDQISLIDDQGPEYYIQTLYRSGQGTFRNEGIKGDHSLISFSGYELAQHLMTISDELPGGRGFAAVLFFLIPILAIYKLLYDNLIIQRKLTGILLGLYSSFAVLFYFNLQDGANFEHIAIGAILTLVMGFVIFLFSTIYQ